MSQPPSCTGRHQNYILADDQPVFTWTTCLDQSRQATGSCKHHILINDLSRDCKDWGSVGHVRRPPCVLKISTTFTPINMNPLTSKWFHIQWPGQIMFQFIPLVILGLLSVLTEFYVHWEWKCKGMCSALLSRRGQALL